MITIDGSSSKKEALVACLQHWQWLTDNPGKYKDDWPELSPYTRDDCYCCEYMSYQPLAGINLDCRNCPLSGYAWEPGPWAACMEGESFYAEWYDLDPTADEELTAAAQKMVDACKQALEDLE